MVPKDAHTTPDLVPVHDDEIRVVITVEIGWQRYGGVGSGQGEELREGRRRHVAHGRDQMDAREALQGIS